MKGNITMTSEQVKEFALSLAYADTENKVVEILKSANLWSRENWIPFAHEGVAGNQQSNAANALVEKIVNSVDAVLIRECLKKGIDPRGEQAPKSMKDAQRLFFDIPEGNLHLLGQKQRNQLAEDNICFVVTGTRNSPSYAIIDTGEGQSPSQFTETFLKVSQSNKSTIPFVQGKFGMGGTGALPFSSKEHKIQLIISKRCPEILNIDGDEQWGITVIREEDGDEIDRNATYTYLAPANRKILAFDADSLPLLPKDKDSAYGKEWGHGTFIKVYDYEIERKYSDLVNFGMRSRFEVLVPDITLPVKMYDRRHTMRRGKSPEATLAGLTDKILTNKDSFLEDGIYYADHFTVDGERMDYLIFLLKKETAENMDEKDGIILTLNGQHHGDLGKKSFFKRNAIKLGFIAESLLVFVNINGLSHKKRGQLVMSSRDRKRNSPFTRKVEKKLEEILSHHDGLKEANAKIGEALARKNENKTSTAAFKKLLQSHPSVLRYLLGGDDIRYADIPDKKPYEGKEPPTFFKAKKDFTYKKPKPCQIGRELKIEYETDAKNDYFNGIGNRTVYLDGEKLDEGEFVFVLSNGKATLLIPAGNNWSIDSMFKLTLEVTDDLRPEPFKIDSFFRIVKPTTTTRSKKRDPKNNKAIPNPTEIRKDRWSEFMPKMDEFSALRVIDDEYFINMDNKYIIREIKDAMKSKTILESHFKWGMMLVGLAILASEGKNKRRKQGDSHNEEEENLGDKVAEFTKIVAPALIPIIGLGKLDEKDFGDQEQNDDEE